MKYTEGMNMQLRKLKENELDEFVQEKAHGFRLPFRITGRSHAKVKGIKCSEK